VGRKRRGGGKETTGFFALNHRKGKCPALEGEGEKNDSAIPLGRPRKEKKGRGENRPVRGRGEKGRIRPSLFVGPQDGKKRRNLSKKKKGGKAAAA